MKNIYFTLWLGICVSLTPALAQNQPVVAAISLCEPNPGSDENDPDIYGAGAYPARRRMELTFAYWRRDPIINKDIEIDNTDIVELCMATVVNSNPPPDWEVEISCPYSDSGIEAWRIWDRADDPTLLDDYAPIDARVADSEKADWVDWDAENVTELTWPKNKYTPAIYGDNGDNPDITGEFLFIQVTANGVRSEISGWKTCPVPQMHNYLNIGNELLFMAPFDSTPNPWTYLPADDPVNPNGINPAAPFTCRRLEDGGAPVNPGLNRPACVDQVVAERTQALLPMVNDWQRDNLGIDARGAPLSDRSAWQNSEDKYCNINSLKPDAQCKANPNGADCIYCPAQFVINTSNSFGLARTTGAVFYLRPDDITDAKGVGYFDADAARAQETILHESFHMLQNRTGTGPVWNVENLARAIAPNACLHGPDFPVQVTGDCVSVGKLVGHTDFGEGRFFSDPSEKAFSVYYGGITSGAAFWRYFFEQFAIPPGHDDLARPEQGTNGNCPASARPMPVNPTADLGDRISDEGVDLLSYFLELFLANANSDDDDEMTVRITDQLFKETMGKSLAVMMFDMHTASLLKDYITGELRWQMQWLGDFNANPGRDPGVHPDPANVVGPGNIIPKIPIPDYKHCCAPLVRYSGYSPTLKSGCIDPSITSCPGPNDQLDNFDGTKSVVALPDSDTDDYFATLQAGGQLGDLTTPVHLNPFGAAYLRVLPDAGTGRGHCPIFPQYTDVPMFPSYLRKIHHPIHPGNGDISVLKIWEAPETKHR